MSFFYLGLRVVRYAKVSFEALIILKTIMDLRKVSHTNNKNEEKIYSNAHDLYMWSLSFTSMGDNHYRISSTNMKIIKVIKRHSLQP